MTEPEHISRTVVVTTAHKARWAWWRDAVLVIQSVAIVALVLIVVGLQGQVAQRSDDQRATAAQAATERAALSAKLDKILLENSRLRALLLSNGIDPTPAVSPQPSSSQPQPSPSSGSAPAPRASARPRAASAPRPPAGSSPRPKPQPSPTPSPSPTSNGICLPLPLLPCIG